MERRWEFSALYLIFLRPTHASLSAAHLWRGALALSTGAADHREEWVEGQQAVLRHYAAAARDAEARCYTRQVNAARPFSGRPTKLHSAYATSADVEMARGGHNRLTTRKQPDGRLSPDVAAGCLRRAHGSAVERNLAYHARRFVLAMLGAIRRPGEAAAVLSRARADLQQR